jgi:hypothetical protein
LSCTYHIATESEGILNGKKKDTSEKNPYYFCYTQKRNVGDFIYFSPLFLKAKQKKKERETSDKGH